MDLKTKQVCTLELIKEYDQVCWRYGVSLQRPLIVIVAADSFLGRWNPIERRIELTETLLLKWSWDEVCSVLKHEMAHQIVSEVFLETDSSHGASFIKAGKMLGLEDRFLNARTESSTVIAKNSLDKEQQPLLLRIEKLMSLAQSDNEHEASLAMNKAQQLLAAHHLQSLTTPPEFILTIVPTKKKRITSLQSRICSLLMQFYAVDIVIGETFDIQSGSTKKTFELFGRPENVVIAEYTYHFLEQTIDGLWKKYQLKNAASTALKKSYQLGLIIGFETKLKAAQNPTPSTDAAQKNLMITERMLRAEKKALKKFIQQRHPRLSRRSSGRQSIDTHTYNQGLNDGHQIIVHKGLSHKIKTGLKLLGF